MSVSKRVTRVLVDSNIFLRMFVKEDERMFEDCRMIFTQIGRGAIAAYIPTVVIAEVSFVLASWYKRQKEEILEAIESVAASGIKVVDDLRLPLAMKLYKEHNVKLIDCLLASSKRLEQAGTVVLSYDRDFDKLGIRRMEPGELLKKFSKT